MRVDVPGPWADAPVSYVFLPLSILLLAWMFQGKLGVWLAGLFPALLRHVDRTVYGPWQGCYFAFEGRQVRFRLAGETVWIVERDLFRLLAPAPSERELRVLAGERGPIPGHTLAGITDTGALRLLALRTQHRRASPRMIRFRLWLEREALPNVRRLERASI